jgi:hypothetical protein
MVSASIAKIAPAATAVVAAMTSCPTTEHGVADQRGQAGHQCNPTSHAEDAFS